MKPLASDLITLEVDDTTHRFAAYAVLAHASGAPSLASRALLARANVHALNLDRGRAEKQVRADAGEAIQALRRWVVEMGWAE